MHHSIVRIIAAVSFSVLLFSAPGVAAQEVDDNGGRTEVVDEVDSAEGPFAPGTFDLTFHGGAARLFWLWGEPGVELGVVEVADGITIGAGANLNAGFCWLCSLVSVVPFATGIESISAWYVSPMARGTVHFNLLARALELPELDAYAGIMVGPSLYRLAMETDPDRRYGASASTNVFSVIGGPLVGLRYTFSGDSGFFVAAELRTMIEAGVSTTTVEITDEEDEALVEEQSNDLQRGAAVADWTIGLGFRF